MIWLFVPAVMLGLFLVTFALFIAVMRLREMRDSGELSQLHWSVTWAAYALLGIGLVFDLLLNLGPMTVVFLEFPREPLFTGRVRRHKFHSTGWRNTMALWWCRNWLTPFDARHCK